MTSALLAASLLALISTGDPRTARDEQLRARFRDVNAQLGEYNGGPVDDAYRALSTQLFGVVHEWAGHVLESQPDIADADLARAIQGIASALDGDALPHVTALRLSPDPDAAWVVSYAPPWLGTFFVITREDGRARVAWDIKDAARDEAGSAEIRRWGVDVEPVGHDGPLEGTVHPLPPAANGNPRFYVDAITLPFIGQSRPGQISVWEWNGREATPVFIETYATSWTIWKVTEDGDRLRIAVQQPAQTFFTCGSCGTSGEPTGVWTLKITPEGVEDEGRRWDHPELALLDELVARVRDGKRASDLAATSVVRRLRSWLRAQTDPCSYPLLMVSGYEVVTHGAGSVLDLASDAARLKLTVVRRRGRLYATALRIRSSL
jgi:hypothetical protein